MKITPEWLQDNLYKLPAALARAAEEYETAKEVLLNKENEYEREFAKEWLKAKAEGNTDTKCKYIATEKLYPLKMELIKTEAEARRKQLQVDELANKFAAVRKMANILEVEIKHLGD